MSKNSACDICTKTYPECKKIRKCGVQSVIEYIEKENIARLNLGEVAVKNEKINEFAKYKAVADYFLKEGNNAEKIIVSNILKGWE